MELEAAKRNRFSPGRLTSQQTWGRRNAYDAPRPAFTARQGQFLAFIHAYTLVNGRPPAEADMMRFFRLTPPSVHQMILKLEQLGLISRQPGVPRSIVVLLDRSALPMLEPSGAQPVKTSVQRY